MTLRPLSNFALFSTAFVDEAREEVAKVFCDHRLEPRRRVSRLGAWQNMARLSNMAVTAMGYGADVEIDPGAFGNFYLLMLPYAGSALVQHGKQQADVNVHAAGVLSPDERTLMQWDADCSNVIVRIDRGALERQLSIMLGGAPVSNLRFDLSMPQNEGTGHWWRMLNLLVESLERGGATSNSLATSLHESLLLVTLLGCQNNTYTARLGTHQQPLAPRHVRRVEAYIDENADKPLTISDLVVVSGVSARALFDGFRHFRDTSPLAYLRSVRLERVRDQLLCAGEDDSVTKVATQWGFNQLGRFAAQYKATYGESPSETLRSR